ncbi:hypothetical protein ACOMHN_033874 [Nucella lapillus]
MEQNGAEWNGVEWSRMEGNGAEWNGMEWNGVEGSRMEWKGMEWNEVEWNGGEWSRMEWSGVEWNVSDIGTVSMSAVEDLFIKVLRLLLASSSNRGCRQDIQDLFRQLGRRNCQTFNLRRADDLEEDLDACDCLFQLQTDGRNRVSVSPRTTLTICRRHSNESGSCPDGTCLDLHFCLFFLLSGECRYGDGCLFGHSLRSTHNQRLLQRHLLQGLNLTELRALFTLPHVRQGVTLPQVCRYYNASKGCNRGMACHSLHMCWHYVREKCKFGVRCIRNHDIDNPQVKSLLTLFGVEVRGRQLRDLLREVRQFVQEHENENERHVDDERTGARPRTGHGAMSRRFASVPDLTRQLQMMSVTPRPYGAPAGQRAEYDSGPRYPGPFGVGMKNRGTREKRHGEQRHGEQRHEGRAARGNSGTREQRHE